MNLNNITLSPRLLTDLYSHSLIEGTKVQAKVKEPVKKAGKNYLGDNLQRVVIASEYAHAVFIPEESLDFLTTILAACNLSLADVAILNLHDMEPAEAHSLITSLNAEKLLLFGVETTRAGLPVRFPHYQKQVVNQLTCLSAPMLEEIGQTKEKKGKLWASLKILFNI